MNVIPLQFANTGSSASTADQFASKRSTVLVTDVITGIAIAAVVPALFWTGLAWAASRVFDLGLTAGTLAALAAGIATFLSIVCSAVIAAD
jgi:hypothetical protein